MRPWLREVAVIAVAGTVLAGPFTALCVALAPVSWRQPRMAWAVLAACLSLVAALRRRRWRQP